jgi:V8-like Glu-specific endopeptidase
MTFQSAAGDSFSVCSGTFISPRDVLTAAHCIVNITGTSIATTGANNTQTYTTYRVRFTSCRCLAVQLLSSEGAEGGCLLLFLHARCDP